MVKRIKKINKRIMWQVFLLLVGSLCLLSGTYGALIDSNEAYWTFDNILTDVTGNGHTLTNSGATDTSEGKINGSYTFDSTSDYLQSSQTLTSYGITGTSSPRTFSFWAYQSAASSTGFIFNNRDTTGLINTYFSGGQICSQFYKSGGVYETICTPYTVNTWTFITVIYDGNQGYLYKNGVLQSSTPSFGPLLTATTNYFNIGNSYAHTQGLSNLGRIDEFSIWSRALSASEIEQLYNNGNGLQYPFTEPEPEPVDLTNQIVSYYSFDSDATDISGNGNDGTNNGATLTNEGKLGGAYDFDGINDYVDINNLNLNTGSDYSVSWWMNADSYSTIANMLYLEKEKANAFGLYTDGKIHANIYAGGTNEVTSSINTANWYHIVFTRSKTSGMKLYVNNVLVSTNPFTGDGDAVSRRNIIGAAYTTSPLQYFNGKIDEVGIWNRALSESEIEQLYNNGNGLQYPFTTQTSNETNTTNSSLLTIQEANTIIEEVFNTKLSGHIIRTNQKVYTKDILGNEDEIVFNKYISYNNIRFGIYYGNLTQTVSSIGTRFNVFKTGSITETDLRTQLNSFIDNIIS